MYLQRLWRFFYANTYKNVSIVRIYLNNIITLNKYYYYNNFFLYICITYVNRVLLQYKIYIIIIVVNETLTSWRGNVVLLITNTIMFNSSLVITVTLYKKAE